jgi:hypothetical protein
LGSRICTSLKKKQEIFFLRNHFWGRQSVCIPFELSTTVHKWLLLKSTGFKQIEPTESWRLERMDKWENTAASITLLLGINDPKNKVPYFQEIYPSWILSLENGNFLLFGFGFKIFLQ